MRILLDATVMEQPLTGVAKTALMLYQACLKLEPSLRVAALHCGSLVTNLPTGFTSEDRSSFLPKWLWRQMTFPAMVSAGHHDAIHFPWNGGVPRFFSMVTVVTTLHDVLPLEIPGFFPTEHKKHAYVRQRQKDIDRTDLLLTVSEYSERQIIEKFSVADEPLVLYHGPTLPTEHEALVSTRGNTKPYFLYVGGYDARKGIAGLLKVFLRLHREKRLSTTLLLTGNRRIFSEEFRKLLSQGTEMGIVMEKGYVPDSELVELFQNARALVYPSKYEGFGLPPLEAMSLGCPVITTRYTSLPEVCGDAALYIEPEDERCFSDAIIAMDSDPSLRSSLREKGLKQAAKFTWENAAQRFLSALEKTILSKRTRRE